MEREASSRAHKHTHKSKRPGQFSHGPPSGPKEPGAQLRAQRADDTLPGGDVFPAGQAWQDAEPRASLYLPDSHIWQSPPSGPENPSSHKQLVCTELPWGAVEPAGHARQRRMEDDAKEEYVPFGHCRHDEDPFSALYFPAGQDTHSPSTPVYP